MRMHLRGGEGAQVTFVSCELSEVIDVANDQVDQLLDDRVEAPRLHTFRGELGVPVHRVAAPEHECAHRAHGFDERWQMLLDPARAAYVTGTVLEVSGGWTAYGYV